MRPEKTYLVDEAKKSFGKIKLFFPSQITKELMRMKLPCFGEKLAERGAEFHVVKNSSLRLAAPETVVSELNDELQGHTAIVIGGEDPSGVAKAWGNISRIHKKFQLKGAVLIIAFCLWMISRYYQNYPD